ncbi:MAG: acyltransferase [Cyclobacteriaceae bacterium]|nr:acyltransferase [Cyclobacteriaceae bacterium]
MNLIRNIYLRICERIFSVGKAEYEKKVNLRIRENSTVKSSTVFYSGSSLNNFSNDKSRITLGENCHIYGALTVLPFGGKITFGDNCSFGEFSRITSTKGIYIGSRVMIAHNVNILDNNSHPTDDKLRHEDFINSYNGHMKEYDLKAKEIVIEDDVWIGFNSIILKGVHIGKSAIIGAGSIVTKDVPEYSVVAGNPLRAIHNSN